MARKWLCVTCYQRGVWCGKFHPHIDYSIAFHPHNKKES